LLFDLFLHFFLFHNHLLLRWLGLRCGNEGLIVLLFKTLFLSLLFKFFFLC